LAAPLRFCYRQQSILEEREGHVSTLCRVANRHVPTFAANGTGGALCSDDDGGSTCVDEKTEQLHSRRLVLARRIVDLVCDRDGDGTITVRLHQERGTIWGHELSLRVRGISAVGVT